MKLTQKAAVSPSASILTLDPEPAAQTRFNELRREHFPPERNFLNAHLTLFHHLPSEEESIVADLAALVRGTPVFDLKVTGIMSLGGGVAFRIENDLLSAFHRRLQQRWAPWLTPQDRQKRTFHITIQNKVPPVTARDLKEKLTAAFEPFQFQGTGLSLWSYRDGPWEWRQTFPLPGRQTDAGG